MSLAKAEGQVGKLIRKTNDFQLIKKPKIMKKRFIIHHQSKMRCFKKVKDQIIEYANNKSPACSKERRRLKKWEEDKTA